MQTVSLAVILGTLEQVKLGPGRSPVFYSFLDMEHSESSFSGVSEVTACPGFAYYSSFSGF